MTTSNDQNVIATEIALEIAETIILDAPHADDAKVYAAYKWLRNNRPLARAVVDGFDPVYLVSKHADILEIERHPEVFSSGGGPGAGKGNANPLFVNKAGDDFTRSINNGSLRILDALTYLDPPEHTEVRKVTNDWFRPGNLLPWE